MSTIFTKIINKELPATFVWEDEVCVAFMDIRPVNPGHLLIVPRQEEEWVVNLPDEVVGHLFKVGKHLNQALRDSDIRCQGVNFLMCDGKAAGQEVFHAHLHVIPRYEGDGFGFRYPGGYGKTPAREELESLAEEIRRRL